MNSEPNPVAQSDEIEDNESVEWLEDMVIWFMSSHEWDEFHSNGGEFDLNVSLSSVVFKI